MLKQKRILGLATLSSCNEFCIRDRAQSMLMSLLLQSHGVFDVDDNIATDNQIKIGLNYLLNRYNKTNLEEKKTDIDFYSASWNAVHYVSV